MEHSIGDLTIIFVAVLICIYMQWNKLFPE